MGCCAALLPLTLTKVKQPETPESPRLRPMLAVTRSPLAAAGVVVAALSSASFRMVGPIYGQEVGLSAGQIAWFLSAFVLGGALAQFPIGWLADKYDRRVVFDLAVGGRDGQLFYYRDGVGHGHFWYHADRRIVRIDDISDLFCRRRPRA